MFTPQASISSGNFTEPITIELTTNTPGAIIKYTTNGSFPLLTSQTYEEPITINSTTTLKAKAYLYIGPEFSSSSSSRGSGNYLKSTPNLVPSTIVWVSSNLLTEVYTFPRKSKSSNNKQEIIAQEEKPQLTVSAEK